MSDGYECDVLVIGGGGAGAMAAIHAAAHGADVLLVEKGIFGKSGCTILGGFSCNAALGWGDERDDPQVHFEDTVREGKFLSNQGLVDIYSREAPSRVLELRDYGVRFETLGDRLAQDIVPGSTYPRSCYVDHRTGQAMMASLRGEVLRRQGIQVHHETIVARLLLDGHRAAGAVALRLRDGQAVSYRAKATIIATGGGSQLFRYSTTSIDNTGDGLLLAYEAGAELQDMEFIQFYPTVQCYPRMLGMNPTAPTWLRLRGKARIYNAHGREFIEEKMPDWHLRATRDLLSQVIYQEIIEGRGSPHGGVFIDVSHLPAETVERELGFSGFFQRLLAMGVDLRAGPIETAVAAHYFMGGIKVNDRCETLVPGLFAAGEAMAGVDGANRLAGNALSEILVFGARAGDYAAECASRLPSCPRADDSVEVDSFPRVRASDHDGSRPIEVKRALQRIMWEKVGVIREGGRLQEAKDDLDALEGDHLSHLTMQSSLQIYNRELLDAIEVRKMVKLAQIVVAAASMRKESRGAHSRVDHPHRDDANWLVNLVAKKSDEGVQISKVPVLLDRMQLDGS